MADKPKGNVLYEVLIVVLAIVLMFTILYPQRIWHREDVQESICRTRMDAIHNLELQYINQVYTYSDSLDKVKNLVLSTPDAVAAIDSLILWEGLVDKETLEALVDEKSFPEDLRDLIRNSLVSGEPLRNLGQYDSLQYKLIDRLKAELQDTAETQKAALDTNIQWTVLVGERQAQNLVDASELSRTVRRRTISAIQNGEPIEETQAWSSLYSVFYGELEDKIRTAELEDIWTMENQEDWKEQKRKEWEAALDTLSEQERDSLWVQNRRDMWDNIKEIVWKEESKELWKKERQTWREENRPLWMGDVTRKWEKDREKEWIESIEEDQGKLIELFLNAQKADTLETDEMTEMPEDTTQAAAPIDTLYEAEVFFKAKRDSLWRIALDTIRTQEFDKWIEDNQSYIEDVIESMWQSDRRVTWEEEGYERWLKEMDENKAARWEELKDALWQLTWMDLWKIEEEKLASKKSALRRLDLAAHWAGLFSSGELETLVSGLDLPDNKELWERINKKTDEKGSRLYRMGLVELFRKPLIESLDAAPVAGVPYLISVQDTGAIKKVSISCPIAETSDLSVGEYKGGADEDTAEAEMQTLVAQSDTAAADTMAARAPEPEAAEETAESDELYTVALKVDPETKDTLKIRLELPTSVKLFGGGEIRNHGFIDEDGKKSWQKKGR